MTKRIGRYEVVAELGRGGFGYVYRGLDPTVGRPVAIKVLAAGSDEGMLVRFRGEAATSGRLRHPNIVTVFDSGDQDGVPFIVMELVEGQDLQRIIESRKPISILDKTEILTQVAAGLKHAHAEGIIHRDVKPANVMLLPDGSVKIMDFGIALITQSTNSRLTPRGATIGTMQYMAPEQFKGAEPDIRSDIFAYGLIFYELFSGVHPFHAAEAAAQMYNILSVEPVPLNEICPGCPEELQAVVAKLLQKDPDLRYQNLDDALFDIESIRLKLRQERADELVAEGRAARTQKQLETALKLIRQALQLAPSHKEARELRPQLQIEVQRETARPKVDELLRQGKEALAEGNATEAVHRFESAIRLDPQAREISALLEQARTAAERSQAAARLAVDAENRLRTGDFSGALRQARQAIDLFPGEQRAQSVITTAEARLAEEARKAQLAQSLTRAKRLIEIKSWTEASTLLANVKEQFPGNTEIESLFHESWEGQEAEQRERRLASGLSAAKERIQSGDLEGALSLINDIAAENPDSADVQRMRDFLNAEFEARVRREITKLSIEQARSSADRSEFDAAIRILDAALSRYPADSELQRERHATLADQKEAAWNRARKEALTEAESLRAGNRYADALRRLNDFLTSHGTDVAVTELRDTIGKEQETARRSAELREYVRQAQEMLARGQAAEAKTFLQAPPAHLKGEPQLTALLGAAQLELKKQAERDIARERVVRQAAALAEQGAFAEAFGELDGYQKSFGKAAEIDDARGKIEEVRKLAQRDVDHLTARVNALLATNPLEAAKLLEAAPGRIRNRAELANLARTVKDALEERGAVVKIVEQARELCGSARYDEALQALDTDYLKRVRCQPLVAEARKEIAAAYDRHREQRRRDHVRAISDLIAAQDYDNASRMLTLALEEDPGAQELLQFRAEIERFESQQRREQERRERVASARALIALNPNEALARLQALDRERPNDLDIAPVLKEAHSAIAQQREQDRKERVAAARALIGQNPENALANLKVLEREYPNDPDVASAQQEANAALARRRDQEFRERLAAATGLVGKSPEEALAQLTVLDREQPNDPNIASAIQQVQAAIAQRREQERKKRVAAAKGLVGQRPEVALADLKALEREYPNDREIASAQQEANAALVFKRRRELLVEVDALCAKEDFEAALAKLNQATPDVYGDIGSAREEALKNRAAQAVRNANSDLARDPKAALKLLETLAPPIRERSEVQEALQKCREAVAAAERSAAFLNVENLYQKGKLSQARSAHAQTVEQYGRDALSDDLIARILAAIEEQKPTRELMMRRVRWGAIGIGAALTVAAGVWIAPHVKPTQPTAVVVEIHSDPNGASVHVGEKSCVTPHCRLELAPGAYDLQGQLNGYRPIQQSLTIEAGKVLNATNLTFDPIIVAPPSGPTIGTLVVQAGESNALVFVDGSPAGRTDAEGHLSIKTEASTHSVRVEKTGYEAAPAKIATISQNKSLSVQFKLVPEPASIELRGAPAGVELSENGTLLRRTDGTGLFKASVRPGSQTLRIAYNNAVRDVPLVIDPGQVATLEWAKVTPPIAVPPSPKVVTPETTSPPGKTVASGITPPPPPKQDPQEQDWQSARASSDVAQLQAFIQKYSNGPHAAEAQSMLDALTWSRTNQNDAQSLRTYISRFPSGAHVRDAQSRVTELAWNGVDKSSLQALRDFIQQNGDNPHRSDAQTLIDRLERERADAERQKQERDKQTALSQVAIQGISSAIDQFNMAFEKKQPNALKLIWPGADKKYLDAMVKPGATFAMRLETKGEPIIVGDTASIICNVVSTTIVRGETSANQKSVKAQLRNAGNRWVFVNPFGAN